MASLIQKKLGAYSAYYFEDPALIASRQQPRSKSADKQHKQHKHKHKHEYKHNHNHKQKDDKEKVASSRKHGSANSPITAALTRKLAALEPQTATNTTNNAIHGGETGRRSDCEHASQALRRPAPSPLRGSDNHDDIDPAHLFSGTRMANKYRQLSQSSSAYDYHALLDTAVLPHAVTLQRLGFREMQPQHLQSNSNHNTNHNTNDDNGSQFETQLNPVVLERYKPSLHNTPFLPTHSVFGTGAMREQVRVLLFNNLLYLPHTLNTHLTHTYILFFLLLHIIHTGSGCSQAAPLRPYRALAG